MAKILCPKCGSQNTSAQYVHDPCPNSAKGYTKWEAPAESATPDGLPFPLPCPTPDDGTMCNATGIRCQDCGHTW